MTTDPTIHEQSYAYFMQEAPELLQVLEQELLNREDWTIHKVHTLMRTTHTLKGSAASVGLDSIKSVAHSLEDIFKALCKPDLTVNPEIEALLLEAYDCLRIPLMAEISGNQTDHSDVFDRAAAIFSQLQDKLGDCFGEEAYIPTSAELGFDVTQSIFEVGVTQRLEQIAQAIASGEPSTVAATLQTQAEVFLGLAQSLNLPGFGRIAEATLTALAQHPEGALTIAETALADFEQGQAEVLAGDRTEGGQPSPALLQLAVLEETPLVETAAETLLDIWTLEEPSPPAPSPAPKAPSASPTVRIEVDHLDRLNYLVGELLTNQNRQSLQAEQLQSSIQEFLRGWQQHQRLLDRLQSGVQSNPTVLTLLNQSQHLGAVVERIDEYSRQSGQAIKKQRLLFSNALDSLLEARMVPLGDIFNRLSPLLQQLETLHGKAVALTLGGTEILLDKAVAEKLYDPLLHLVRNAFDHGIEPPERRQQRGKVPIGQIEISAFHQGSHLTIQVRDDGQGLNYDRIRQRAVEQHLVSPEEALNLDQAHLMDFLFEPGFSTADQISNLSGRGIGLDVVRAQLEALQGAVTVYSEPGRGTTFLLQIPFSLTMANLLLCQAGTTTYALLTDAVEQVLVPSPEQLRSWEGGKALRWGKDAEERLVSIVRLEQILSYDSPKKPAVPSPGGISSDSTPIVLLRCGEQRLGLEVDQIVGEQELVIRPLGAMIVPPPYVYGGSILADGGLTLVIDGAALAKTTLERHKRARARSLVSTPAPLPGSSPLPLRAMPSATVLLVDDSLTQRQNLALTLEKFGYRVLHAEDGVEALEQLERADVRLVICDLEMPRMNGFEFLRHCQQHPTLSTMPIVILTSKTEQKHRLMAIELGAAAYLNKPCLEPQLLATVSGLI